MCPVLRVLLADDHAMVRDALGRWLDRVTGFRVVGTAPDGCQAILGCAALQPDVLVLDLLMPGPSPAEVVASVREVSPRTRVLVLSGYDDDARIQEMRAANVAGYLLKLEPLDTLARAIRAVAAGGTWFSGPILDRLAAPLDPALRSPAITPREADVLRALLAGRTHERIAEELGLSSRTVTRVVRRLCDRLGLESRADLLSWAAHGDKLRDAPR